MCYSLYIDDCEYDISTGGPGSICPRPPVPSYKEGTGGRGQIEPGPPVDIWLLSLCGYDHGQTGYFRYMVTFASCLDIMAMCIAILVIRQLGCIAIG